MQKLDLTVDEPHIFIDSFKAQMQLVRNSEGPNFAINMLNQQAKKVIDNIQNIVKIQLFMSFINTPTVW